jgi:hypothetical protein
MSTKKRTYNDLCGLSHALELVGERWAILILRELAYGPKRFTDIRTGLPGLSPDVLAQRLVQTYFDPVANRTWAFGALPSDAREVDVSAATAAATVASVPADPEAVAKGDLPRGMRVFVAALDGPREVPVVAARDRSGRVLLTCEEGRCTPTQEESP